MHLRCCKVELTFKESLRQGANLFVQLQNAELVQILANFLFKMQCKLFLHRRCENVSLKHFFKKC